MENVSTRDQGYWRNDYASVTADGNDPTTFREAKNGIDPIKIKKMEGMGDIAADRIKLMDPETYFARLFWGFIQNFQ